MKKKSAISFAGFSPSGESWFLIPIPNTPIYGKSVIIYHRVSESKSSSGVSARKNLKQIIRTFRKARISEANAELIGFFEQCRSPLKSKLLPKILDWADDKRNEIVLVVASVCRTAHTLDGGKRILQLLRARKLRVILMDVDRLTIDELDFRSYRRQLIKHEAMYQSRERKSMARRVATPPPRRGPTHFNIVAGRIEFKPSFERHVAPVFSAAAKIGSGFYKGWLQACAIATWLNDAQIRPLRTSEYSPDLVRKMLANSKLKAAYAEFYRRQNSRMKKRKV